MQGIFKVKRIGEKSYVNSRNGGQTAMKRITLKELGNDFAGEFVVAVFGQTAEQNVNITSVCSGAARTILNEE